MHVQTRLSRLIAREPKVIILIKTLPKVNKFSIKIKYNEYTNYNRKSGT